MYVELAIQNGKCSIAPHSTSSQVFYGGGVHSKTSTEVVRTIARGRQSSFAVAGTIPHVS